MNTKEQILDDLTSEYQRRLYTVTKDILSLLKLAQAEDHEDKIIIITGASRLLGVVLTAVKPGHFDAALEDLLTCIKTVILSNKEGILNETARAQRSMQ